MRHYAWLLAMLVTATAALAAPLEWNFDTQAEVSSNVNLQPGRVSDGKLSGEAVWDPHFYVQLPKEGVDANELTWLEVRLYSSAPADLLDIYYKSPDGRWCLGGKFPIARGWAVYRVDLTQNKWRETQTGDVSRQWGGPSKRVVSFRLDPGNEAGRWVMVDWVKLMPKPEGAQEGVTEEPRGTEKFIKLEVKTQAKAGERLPVQAAFNVEGAAGLKQLTSYIRLMRGEQVMFSAEVVTPSDPNNTFLAVMGEIPLSSYWYPGTYTVQVGTYELDPAPDSVPASAQVEISNPRSGGVSFPTVKLQKMGGDAAITIDGKPFPGLMTSIHGGDVSKLHKEFGQAGVHLFSDWFGTSIGSNLGHVKPDEYNYAEFDKYFATVLEADPDALFLPHIGVVAPIWWQELHPEERTVYADGRKGPSSFASELWKKESGEDLRKLIAYLQKSPYADRIIGIAFYGGYTAEWQMWGTWQQHRDDYSEPALRAFRGYLKQKYGTDEALRAAWADPQVTLQTAAAPDWAKRRPGGSQVLRDPRTERQAMDYYDFIQNMTADALLYFAHVTREATQGKLLVGTYYAYLSAHGANQIDSGHLQARRVFDSPDIDFLMSPPNYAYRRAGETSTFMSATDSFRMRGKLWLDEADNRTYLSDPSAGYGRSDNLPDSVGVFWREFGYVQSKRAAVSYFDMAGGWYSGQELLSNLGKAVRLATESLPERKPFRPEVCLVVDPDSFIYLRATEAVGAMVRNQLVTMPQAGVPFDYCLLSDLGQPWMPDYKLYVFLNSVEVSGEMRQVVSSKLQRSKATALFFYAPGYFQGDEGSLDNVQKLTGIKLGCEQMEGRAQLVLEPGSAIAQGMDAVQAVGAETVVAPRFYADDPQAQVLAKLAGTDKAGLVMKRNGAWTAVYSSAIGLPPALMRNVARQAGCHIWVDSDDTFCADNRLVTIHVATEGTKTINLPRKCRVTDALTGKPVPVDGQTVKLEMKKAETRILELQP